MDDFIAKWVKPFYQKGLMRSDITEVKAALTEVDADIIERLLSTRGWRERLVGSWFVGLKKWSQFEDVVGELLLASEVTYAGCGHAFALACLADEVSRRYLVDYLEKYLRCPELFYDQQCAMCALMWIDEQNGTNYAAPFLVPGGLWETFTVGKNEAWHLERYRVYFWKLMSYCQLHFGAT